MGIQEAARTGAPRDGEPDTRGTAHAQSLPALLAGTPGTGLAAGGRRSALPGGHAVAARHPAGQARRDPDPVCVRQDAGRERILADPTFLPCGGHEVAWAPFRVAGPPPEPRTAVPAAGAVMATGDDGKVVRPHAGRSSPNCCHALRHTQRQVLAGSGKGATRKSASAATTKRARSTPAPP